MRTVLRRAGCRNERMCFIMDESNMLDTGFLERLNTLLANGEVYRMKSYSKDTLCHTDYSLILKI